MFINDHKNFVLRQYEINSKWFQRRNSKLKHTKILNFPCTRSASRITFQGTFYCTCFFSLNKKK